MKFSYENDQPMMMINEDIPLKKGQIVRFSKPLIIPSHTGTFRDDEFIVLSGYFCRFLSQKKQTEVKICVGTFLSIPYEIFDPDQENLEDKQCSDVMQPNPLPPRNAEAFEAAYNEDGQLLLFN